MASGLAPQPPATARPADQCGVRGRGAADAGELGFGSLKRGMLLRQAEYEARLKIATDERAGAEALVEALVARVLDKHSKHRAVNARASFEETEAGERDYVQAEEAVFRNQFHNVHLKVLDKLAVQDEEAEARRQIEQVETREWLHLEIKYQRSCLHPSLEGAGPSLEGQARAHLAGLPEEEGIDRALLHIEELTAREEVARGRVEDEYRPVPFILLSMLHRRIVVRLAADEVKAYHQVREDFTLALELMRWRWEKAEAAARAAVEDEARTVRWTLYHAFFTGDAFPEQSSIATAPSAPARAPRRKSLGMLKEAADGVREGLGMLPSGATPETAPLRDPAAVPPHPPPAGPVVRRYQREDAYPYLGTDFAAVETAVAARREGLVAAWYEEYGAGGGLDLLGVARYSAVGCTAQRTPRRSPRRKSLALLQEAAADDDQEGLGLLETPETQPAAAPGMPTPTPPPGGAAGSAVLRHKEAASAIPRHPSLRAVEGLRRDRSSFASFKEGRRRATPPAAAAAPPPRPRTLRPADGNAGGLALLLVAGVAGRAASWRESRRNLETEQPSSVRRARGEGSGESSPSPARAPRRKSLGMLKEAADGVREGLGMLPSGATPETAPLPPPPPLEVAVPPPPFVLLLEVLQGREAVVAQVASLDVTYDYEAVRHEVAKEWYKGRLRARYRRTPEEITHSVAVLEAEARRAAQLSAFDAACDGLLEDAERAMHAAFDELMGVVQQHCRVGISFFHHANAAGAALLTASQDMLRAAYHAKAGARRAAEDWNISTFPAWVLPNTPSVVPWVPPPPPPEEEEPRRKSKRRQSLQMLKEAAAGGGEGLRLLPDEEEEGGA